jgi:hypothetical protein
MVMLAEPNGPSSMQNHAIASPGVIPSGTTTWSEDVVTERIGTRVPLMYAAYRAGVVVGSTEGALTRNCNTDPPSSVACGSVTAIFDPLVSHSTADA